MSSRAFRQPDGHGSGRVLNPHGSARSFLNPHPDYKPESTGNSARSFRNIPGNASLRSLAVDPNVSARSLLGPQGSLRSFVPSIDVHLRGGRDVKEDAEIGRDMHTIQKGEKAPLIAGKEQTGRGIKGFFSSFVGSRMAVMITVYIAIFTDNTVYQIIVPVLPEYIADKFHATPTDLGMLLAVYSVGLVAMSPVIGWISDRIGRTIPLIVGLVCLVITTLIFAAAEDLWLLYFARFAQGISAATCWVVGMALMSDVCSSTELGPATAKCMAVNHMAAMLGPPVGGVLFKFYGYNSLFYYCAGLGAVDLAMRLGLVSDKKVAAIKAQNQAALQAERVARGEPPEDPNSINSEVSIWTIAAKPEILMASGCVMLSSTIIMGLDVVFPLYLTHRYNASPMEIGLAWAGSIIPNLIMAYVCGVLSTKVNTKLLLASGSVILGISTALLAFPGNVPFVPKNLVLQIVLFGLLAVGEELVLVISLPDMGQSAEEYGGENNAKIFGIWNAAYGIGMIAGPLAAGAAYEYVGFLPMMCSIGGVLIVFSVFPFVLYLKSKKNQKQIY